MVEQLPSDIERLIRERRALLWCCQRFDLVDGAMPHDNGLSPTEAKLLYRDTSSVDDALANFYWEAIWLEGADSPLLHSIRKNSKKFKSRPLVVLSSLADSKAILSSEEFLSISVLPGIMDNSYNPDSRYGGIPKRQREKVAYELSKRLSEYRNRALIVIGAQKDSDLEMLYEVIEDEPIHGLKILLVGFVPQKISPKLNASISVATWSGKVNQFVALLQESGIPSAADVPRWSIRVQDRVIPLSAQDTRPILKRYALVAERDLKIVDMLTMNDLRDFFSGSLDNWRAYGAGLPIERAYRTDRSRSLPEEVLHALKKVQSDRDLRILVIKFPSESGSGATTLTRQAAHLAAKNGFPTIILRPEQIDVEPEEVLAFFTTLNERSVEAGLTESPPFLLVLDIEHLPSGPISKVKQLPNIIASSGRNAVILQTTKQSDNIKPFRGNRFISLPLLTSPALETEITLCSKVFTEISDKYDLNLTVPTLEDWTSYQRASRWHHPGFRSEDSNSLFWVALRFFVMGKEENFAIADVDTYISEWISRRIDAISDPNLQNVLQLIAILSSFCIPSPLTTVLRPIFGGIYNSNIFVLIQSLDGILEWGNTSQELGDEMVRFAHKAIADQYLFQSNLVSERSRMAALSRLISNMSPGKPGDVWVAECLAFSVLTPRRGRDEELSWRLDAFSMFPEALRERSKTILHHWARCLYHSAGHERGLSVADIESRYELAVDKLRKAIELPRQTSRGEHPSHLYNTLGTALTRFARHLNEQGATDRSNMLWKEACKSFENSLAISGGDNIEALLAFAQRLLEHAQSISSSNSIEKTDDLLLALSLVDDAIDLLRDYPAPDPEWEPYLNEQKSTALDMLNREASDEFIAKLKEGEKPEIGYICEARIKLNKHANELDGGIPAAIDILEQAEAKHIRLSARTLLFKVSLIKDERSGKNHNFKTIAELYDKLSHDPDYKMRIIDIFRHAVSLYQTGQYERGQKRFKELRGYLSREGLTPPKVRDRLLENDKPFRPKSFTIKVVRVVSNWKAEGFIEEINQTIPLRPRHYAPPPIEREIRKCAIRFEIFGPLAVPLRFEPI